MRHGILLTSMTGLGLHIHHRRSRYHRWQSTNCPHTLDMLPKPLQRIISSTWWLIGDPFDCDSMEFLNFPRSKTPSSCYGVLPGKWCIGYSFRSWMRPVAAAASRCLRKINKFINWLMFWLKWENFSIASWSESQSPPSVSHHQSIYNKTSTNIVCSIYDSICITSFHSQLNINT